MVRIREITDPDLRKQVLDVLARDRGCPPSMIPDWFELDDADYSDILIRISKGEPDGAEAPDDDRM
jgi:hypothetical protein